MQAPFLGASLRFWKKNCILSLSRMQCFILGQEEIENICRQAKVLAKEYEDAPRLTGKKMGNRIPPR